MKLDDRLIKQVTCLVVEEMKSGNAAACEENGACSDSYGISNSMDDAAQASEATQRKYLLSTMEDRQKYADVIHQTTLEPEILQKISRVAVEETGMDSYEHKLIKNRLAVEESPSTKGLAVETMTGDRDPTPVEYCPFDVIGAITLTTNPTGTTTYNPIAMLTGGNTVVFSPHPRARNVAHVLVTALSQAPGEVGTPTNLIVMVYEPSAENIDLMTKHLKIRVLVAMSGPGTVKMIVSTGKEAIGAGVSNPPVVVDETADIEEAAKDIVDGCSFNNNPPYITEEGVIAVDTITDYLI